MQMCLKTKHPPHTHTHTLTQPAQSNRGQSLPSQAFLTLVIGHFLNLECADVSDLPTAAVRHLSTQADFRCKNMMA